MLRALCCWCKPLQDYLSLEDYDREKSNAADRIVREMAVTRGLNASLCQGGVLTQKRFDQLVRNGDAAAMRLMERA